MAHKLGARYTYTNEHHGKKCSSNHGERMMMMIIFDLMAFCLIRSICFVSVCVLCVCAPIKRYLARIIMCVRIFFFTPQTI